MSESRVLVIDTNPEQGRSVAAVLEFVDFTPECWTDVEALCAQKTRPREYAAIVIGGLGEQGDAFYKWLKRDPQFPFVLLLPEQVDAHHGLHPDEHAVLQMPIRHQQLWGCACSQYANASGAHRPARLLTAGSRAFLAI